jgi:hypothetical protein
MIPDIYGASEVLEDAIVSHVNMPSYTHLASVDFHYGYSDPNCTEPNWTYTFVVTHEHGTEVPAYERDANAERVRIIESFLYEVNSLISDLKTTTDDEEDSTVVDAPIAKALNNNPDNLDLEDDWRKTWAKNNPQPYTGA